MIRNSKSGQFESIFRDLTPEEEAEFRSWARQNWTPGTEINSFWHPVIRDEIRIMQRESRS